MRVYIFRHGIAEDHNAEGDFQRKLTPQGRDKVGKVGAFVRKRLKPTLVLTSPLVRAVETAEIFCEALGYTGSIAESQSLAPGSPPETCIRELAGLDGEDVVLVGHNPHLSYVVEMMVSSGNLNYSMKKAALVRIDFDQAVRPGEGELRWALAPGILGI